MKIYTKTGDKGTTSLYGGTKVSKDNIRIETYGTVDELNSYIGLIRSYEIDAKLVEELIIIQKDLFNIGAELATPKDKIMLANGTPRLKVMIKEEDITQLENWIDVIDAELEIMTHFILPGGNQASSHAHVARCICRRAERLIFTLAQQEEIRPELAKYINRLSDYLFTAARKIAKDNNHDEIKWIPGE
ncbi:cob(I)yrinic acid a,c-diamide adenosyltransferase [Faecalibacter macacae]|uniref:Corrinoid adenosyltransferase n=1 Tax=Faecalibacter macacae TaxID=1859289 RepID=A0A3L9M929_9FLAO|nr:cob(I)yrinic acid a,c-diamide adenosyltransferase [Faecalibacter macacae]RLZ09737.1 cob(I)yrinic acid a,c-diamide adenosyltransferase [Faecalibacter macacae]